MVGEKPQGQARRQGVSGSWQLRYDADDWAALRQATQSLYGRPWSLGAPYGPDGGGQSLYDAHGGLVASFVRADVAAFAAQAPRDVRRLVQDCETLLSMVRLLEEQLQHTAGSLDHTLSRPVSGAWARKYPDQRRGCAADVGAARGLCVAVQDALGAGRYPLSGDMPYKVVRVR